MTAQATGIVTAFAERAACQSSSRAWRAQHRGGPDHNGCSSGTLAGNRRRLRRGKPA
jgi:hypothetical protein